MESAGFQELLRRAREGDEAAMGELLGAVRPFLERTARELVDEGRASHTAFDLVQETELRAWDKLEQFEGGEGDDATVARFRAWILKIVRRLALDRRRYRNTERRKPPGYFVKALAPQSDEGKGATDVNLPAAPGPTASENFGAEEEAELVWRAIDELPDGLDRDIVRLYFFEELNLREVSERLEVPYHQVKDRYRTSLKRLEQRLGGLGG